jgi:polar amino acid transport system substrate-binding protein
MEAEVRMVAWDGIFAGVAAGNYDVVASGVTITPERQRAFLFTKPYYDVTQIVLLPKGQTAASFEDLKGKTVGGQIGTTGVFVAQKCGVKLNIREYDDVGLAIQDLTNGRIEAVICDSPVALYYANKKEGFSDKLSIAFRSPGNESFGFVVKKGRQDLVDKLNAGIDAVRAKGIEAELLKKWLGD